MRIDPSPLVDTVVPAEHFPQCPRCGDGPGDECAPIVRIDGVTSDGHRVDVATTVASPLDLPLTGNVALCEELGIEDVTFTWAATTCDGVHDTLELLINDTVVADVSAHIDTGCACLVGPAFPSYSVPLDEARALLVPGINRFGIRKSEGEPGRERTRLAWAYATVRVWGNTERIPVFDHRDVFAPVGVSSFDDPMICEGAAQSGAVDSAGEGVVCGAVWSEDWTGTLPCGLDVSGLGEQRDYTVVIRATDGVATTPVTAAATFTRASEPFLSLDGCVP